MTPSSAQIRMAFVQGQLEQAINTKLRLHNDLKALENRLHETDVFIAMCEKDILKMLEIYQQH